MANNAFDRTNFGLRERPVSADFNRNMSQADRSLRDSLRYLMSARSLSSPTGVPYTGFIGDGFRLVPTSPIGMSVQLTAGLGFFYDPINLPVDLGALDLEGVDDRSAYKPMLLTAPQSFAVPAAPTAGNSRIDIIEARYDRRLEDSQTRRQLDAGTKAFLDHVFFKTLSFALDGQTGTVNSPSSSTAPLSYKVGVVAATGSQVAPSTTVGYVKIAQIDVGPTVTTIDSGVLSDMRPLLFPGGIASWSARWRLQWNGGSPIITATRISAPPGVQVTMFAPGGAVRANAEITVMGGLIQSCPMTVSVGPDVGSGISFGGGDGMMTFLGAMNANRLGGAAIGSGALVATGSPPILTGGAAFFVAQDFQCRYQSGATTNVTQAILEDVDVQATGTCSWVQ